MNNNLQFYSKSEYFDALNQRIEQAHPSSRILLMSMTFDTTQACVKEIMFSLEQAAARGVSVTLSIDAYSFMIDGRQFGPLWFHRQKPTNVSELFACKYAWLDRIGAYPNARVVILNKPSKSFSLWIAGRSHIKAAIVDDYVILGGCNFDDPQYIDVMVGHEGKQLADELHSRLSHIIWVGSTTESMNFIDQELAITNDMTILIDAGTRNQSRIYDEALAMIDAATDWLVITCQFFPNGQTAEHLLRAKRRGVKVEVFYSPPHKHGVIGGLGQQLSVMLEKSKLPRSMFNDQVPHDLPLLHAKIIACDQGLLIGSHNYVQAGVRLGTAEIALRVHSEHAAWTAADKIRSLLDPTTKPAENNTNSLVL